MLITILAGAFILSVVIVVHEFGHFIVAKKSGVFVKTFSMGFGRKLFKKRFGETLYVISMLPFGGYVKFAGESVEGEDGEEEGQKEAPQGDTSDEIPDSEIDPSRHFVKKRPLIRSAVVFAGPFANYVLAVFLYFSMFALYGLQVIETTEIGKVTAGSPADSVGLKQHDTIVSVDGESVDDWESLVDALLEDREEVKRLGIEREGRIIEVDYRSEIKDNTITLGFMPYVPSRIGRVKRDGPAYRAGLRNGVTIDAINDTVITSYYDIERIIHAKPETPLVITWSDYETQHVDTIIPEAKKVLKTGSKTEFKVVGQIGVGPYYERHRVPIHRAIIMGFNSSNNMIVEIVSFLKLLFTGKAGMEALGGPILITQMAGDMARWGFTYLIYFLAFFSINLCIFNLLPILPFDGGHLMLFAYEGVARRPVPRRLRERMAQGGFVLLIVLMAFVVMVDLSRCFSSAPKPF